MTMSNLVIYCHVSDWADLISGSPWTFHTNMETGSCCCCRLATPCWGFVGAGGPASEETGLTRGVAVGVQEGAAAAAAAPLGPATRPTGAAGPVSIAVIGSLPATKAYEGLRGLAIVYSGPLEYTKEMLPLRPTILDFEVQFVSCRFWICTETSDRTRNSHLARHSHWGR